MTPPDPKRVADSSGSAPPLPGGVSVPLDTPSRSKSCHHSRGLCPSPGLHAPLFIWERNLSLKPPGGPSGPGGCECCPLTM